jgi:hypothetical protein
VLDDIQERDCARRYSAKSQAHLTLRVDLGGMTA